MEGVTYRHTFNIYDGDGDLGNLTFQNLPSWLNFDNVRTIFGKPSRSDYQESSQSFFVTVSDENGGKFSQSIKIDVVPENYPPVISYEDASLAYVKFKLIEDGDPVIFELPRMIRIATYLLYCGKFLNYPIPGMLMRSLKIQVMPSSLINQMETLVEKIP